MCNLTGIRPYSEGHPVVGVLVTDGKPSNSAKTQEFAAIVRCLISIFLDFI